MREACCIKKKFSGRQVRSRASYVEPVVAKADSTILVLSTNDGVSDKTHDEKQEDKSLFDDYGEEIITRTSETQPNMRETRFVWRPAGR